MLIEASAYICSSVTEWLVWGEEYVLLVLIRWPEVRYKYQAGQVSEKFGHAHMETGSEKKV